MSQPGSSPHHAKLGPKFECLFSEMANILCWILPPVVVIYGAIKYFALRWNIKLAKQTGLPYIILPWYTGTVFWFIISPFAIPVLRHSLPSFINKTWINFLSPFWTWHLEYEPFGKRSSDTIITVAPGGITFHTCSPEIIAQIGGRRKDFMKPLELYTILDTFGPNLVSTNGALWRHQRKIMAPSFSESHNALVWNETIYQVTAMLKTWETQLRILPRGKYLNLHDTLRTLTFNVVSRGAFGVRILWPGSEGSQEIGQGILNAKAGRGHKLKFGDATLIVVSNLYWLFVVPLWILKWAPSKFCNKIWLGYHEMGTYLDEYITNREAVGEDLKEESAESSLLNSLIDSKSQQMDPGAAERGLTKQQIIGNVFNSLTAGHETTGATMFYSLINLAMYPEFQRKMQADIDLICSGRDPSTWSYDEGSEKLFRSSIDAVVCETLRLYPPNNLVPKHSTKDLPQTLKYKNQEILIPPNSRMLILIASSHRNPNYWPHGPSLSRNDTNIAEFHPERWFLSPSDAEACGGSALDLHPIIAQNTEYKFFKPQRGAFIPWFIGSRDCIGKKFAHIELLLALTLIFREWSVELVVKDGGWEEARREAMKWMREGMSHYATMQLRKGLIPLKVVRRGEERKACFRA